MASVTTDDLATVDALLRTNPLFSHLRLNPEFPLEDAPFFDNDKLLISPRPTLWVKYIVLRANKNAETVAGSLASLALIGEALLFGSDVDILESFDFASTKYGHSLSLARKLAFALGHLEKDTESWRLSSKTFASYGANARNYGMMALADTIGSEFSYLDVKSGFEHFSDYRTNSGVSQKISYLSFKPITFSEDELLSGIAANYSISLTDAVMYVLSHRELGVIKNDILFDPLIEKIWSGINEFKADFSSFSKSDRQYSDVRAFRAAPAFIELESFRNFRAAMQGLYDSPEIRSKNIISSNQFETNFYRNVSSIRDLLPDESATFSALPIGFDRVTAGNLSRSCGLAKIAEQNPDFSNLSWSEMGKLMGHTMDMDRLLSTSTLRSAAQTATDPFVVLILRTLLRAHSPATKDSFLFKKSFQEYVQDNHRGDVVDFIKAVHSLEPAIVSYYVALLDETILSQMPFLIHTAEDVYEVRARLLEWYSDTTGDPTSKDKAKQLRIDRKIAGVRGQINETRLNIDALRFRQWIDSSKLSEFSGIIRQETVVVPSVSDIKGKKGLTELRLVAHRDPNARAAVAIMDCYREFCINPDFGVASYLGRRIRHGTLRGTLLDGLPDPSDFDLNGATRVQFDRWLASFRSSIDVILAKLHFSGKGSSNRAVISPEIDSKEKWDLVTVCLRTLHEQAQADHGAATIPLCVEQYCWYIFEIELRDVQSSVLESRNEFGVFKLKHGSGDPNAIGFEKAVNIALSSRFNTVAAWFRKPPNISPVAEIGDIVEVVLRETRAEFPTFVATLDLNGGDLELSGAVYYHVYDALSIVVRNAGRHGAKSGSLRIIAETEERDLGKALRLDIISRVKVDDEAMAAVQRMQDAGQMGPANADVVEGLSGMRKLEKMKVDRTLSDLSVQCAPENTGWIQVSVWFPMSGIV